MPKLKLFEKCYIKIMSMFVVFILMMLVSLEYIMFNKILKLEIEKSIMEENIIAEKISNDIYILSYDYFEFSYFSKLYSYYENYYSNNHQFLSLYNQQGFVFSSLPLNQADECKDIFRDNSIMLQYKIIKIEGVEYVVIQRTLSDPLSQYTLLYTQNISSVFVSWRSIAITSGFVCFVFIGIVGISLYYILRRIIKPFEDITEIAKEYTIGNYDRRLSYQNHDELGDLSKTFNTMACTIQDNVNQLKKTSGEKQRIIDHLSHEIRTPLTIIQGYGEMLQKVSLNQEQQYDAIEYILQETVRLKEISQRMLLLGKLKDNQEFQQMISLSNLLQKVINHIKVKADTNKTNIIFNEKKDCQIMGDELLLESLFYNLIDNAINAMDGHMGSKIYISILKEKQSINVRINDYGRGMSKEQMQHLGEPFYRIDQSRSRALGGTGLGVALCYQIAEIHHAKITFDSKINMGTSVIISFTTS